MHNSNILIIKFGSNCFINGSIDDKSIRHVAEQALLLSGMGLKIVLVTSGDRAAARRHFGHENASFMSPQELARAGKKILDKKWHKILGNKIEKFIFTDEHLLNLDAGNEFVSDVIDAFNRNSIVRVNQCPDQEADGPSGDNDHFTGWLADHLRPELTAFFTGEVHGIQENPDDPSTVLKEISRINFNYAKALIKDDHVSSDGTGGASKLEVAANLAFDGISRRVLIGNGRQPGAVLGAYSGAKSVGTWIVNDFS